MAKKISLTEPDYAKNELKDLRFFLRSHQTTYGSISCRLDRLAFSLVYLVGSKRQHPQSLFQCWKIVKCKFAFDESILPTLHRGGKGPCDQACRVIVDCVSRNSYASFALSKLPACIVIQSFARLRYNSIYSSNFAPRS